MNLINNIKAAYHANRMDEGYPPLMDDDAYSLLMRDLGLRYGIVEPDDSLDQTRMNLDANGYDND